MNLTENQAIEVAKLAIEDQEKINNVKMFLPTIGRNVAEFVSFGEIVGNNYCTASLPITNELTEDKKRRIILYLNKINIL